MRKLLIKRGRVIDPAHKTDRILDILINDDKIIEIGNLGKRKIRERFKTVDASGKLVVPGLIDMHAHLREPGYEDKETIATGSRAAAMGGITTVCCMPNTSPVIDNQTTVEFILLKSMNEGKINIFPIGSITKGLLGKELAEIGALRRAGVVGISDDGNPVMNSQLMRRALEYAKMFHLPLISHSEDLDLSKGGVMNEGYMSTVLGLQGIPRESEEIMVSRDISLVTLTGGHLHIAHVSTEGSVELVRRAKKKKIKVTCEVTPHHFSLTDSEVSQFDTNTKMNPPLRTKKDLLSIKRGLMDGTIDCIVTDHAPHLEEEKNVEYNRAPFGIIGFETLLPLVFTELVEKRILSVSEAIAKMTINPSRILKLNRGTISKGAIADITVIDPKMEMIISKKFESKSHNSPFIGKKLRGFAVMTIVSGKIVMENRRIV